MEPAPLLQACLNGGRTRLEHAAVPLTPAELADDARRVVAAGARALHLHPRRADGTESLHPDDVAAALAAVRDAVPDIPVGIGTGAWIAPGGAARLEHLRRWHARPDFASVNLNEADAPDTIDLLLGQGVGVEAGLWSVADAERFVRLPAAPRVTRVMVEMTVDDPVAARLEAKAVIATVAAAGIARPVLVHGESGSVWAMVRYAAEQGLATRIGLEDGLELPDGRPAPDNAALVRAAAKIVAAVRRHPATSSSAGARVRL